MHPLFLLLKSFCLRSNIKHSTQCFITKWKISKFIKSTSLRVVISTLFSLFYSSHCWDYISCLIFYIIISVCPPPTTSSLHKLFLSSTFGNMQSLCKIWGGETEFIMRVSKMVNEVRWAFATKHFFIRNKNITFTS